MSDQIAVYLGSRGYTIRKENLEVDDLNLIRKELTVKPFVPKTSLAQPSAFPIYRESNTKIYLPRFYGLDNYGEPEKDTLSLGQNITVSFIGKLRDYQKKIVKQWLTKTKKHGCGLIEADCGAGKTVIATKIISELGKKTLIIVHKEFLLRQWHERLEQFLPGARIGLIQGPTIDIDDKDIVIGMLQSLSMKDYEQSIFNEFGLTIIDECHHISAEVFSRVLFKSVTRRILGLSATMERQDGLTRVFKMFMGPIVARWKRGAQENVTVKAIEYSCDDEDFNKVAKNYRRQTDFVKMITKIVEFSHRTEFILKILKDTWNSSAGQILVIGHRKSQLSYIYEAIKHRGFATVGYYIGGMKEKNLKISEGKNIVVATYKMAEEALDIKSLTTILMATPKKDVRQSVGRIMRSEGDKLVIDIIDTHPNFQRYWTSRRRWYNRQHFNVMYTNVDKYDINEWESLPHRQSAPKKYKPEAYTNITFGKCMV
jgi:superfamily II DNA or RNA helicase